MLALNLDVSSMRPGYVPQPERFAGGGTVLIRNRMDMDSQTTPTLVTLHAGDRKSMVIVCQIIVALPGKVEYCCATKSFWTRVCPCPCCLFRKMRPLKPADEGESS